MKNTFAMVAVLAILFVGCESIGMAVMVFLSDATNGLLSMCLGFLPLICIFAIAMLEENQEDKRKIT